MINPLNTGNAYEWIALALYDLKKKIEKNKGQYEEDLSCTFDRAPSVVYKSSIFPTVRFFVSEKKEKNWVFYVILMVILMQKNLSGHFLSKILFSQERYMLNSWNFHHSSIVWSAKNDKKIIDWSLIVTEKLKEQNQNFLQYFDINLSGHFSSKILFSHEWYMLKS